jgi:hypothetical protein
VPFKSYAQVTALQHKAPAVYARWKKKYGIPKDLPGHVRDGKPPTDRAARRRGIERTRRKYSGR